MTRPAVSPDPGPDEIVALRELRSAIDHVLGSLTPREALIVRRYYGLDGDGCTQDEIAHDLGISGGRIHQIIAKALRRLRHPSRCRFLLPHVVLSPERDRAVKKAEAAVQKQQDEALERAAKQVEQWQLREELRRRIGDEIGSHDSHRHLHKRWWSDERRQLIANALDRVVHDVVTEIDSTDAIYEYLREHVDYSWRIYAAWKRDVLRRCRLSDNKLKITRAFMADGSYLIYARKDFRTWYLFETWSYGSIYPYDQHRWICYVDIRAIEAHRGRTPNADRDMRLMMFQPCAEGPT